MRIPLIWRPRACVNVLGYGREMKPGWIPYRWFWVIGGVLLVACIVMIFQGFALAAVGAGSGGAVMVAVGFLERHRGAPPV